MTNVIADLAIESEAATVLAMRLASAVDQPDDEHERALRRIALAAGQVLGLQADTRCTSRRRWNAWAATATSRIPACRSLFRESPLNSIWEGSGNINALDVLRACGRRPSCLMPG